MKELYLSPVVEFKEFDVKDIITGSPNEGEPVIANEDQSEKVWTGNA